MTDGAERVRQGRLIGILLAGPFLLVCAIAILLPPQVGEVVTLAAIGATFGLSWIGAAIVALTGRTGLAGPVALTLGAVSLAGVIAAAGGVASPILLAVAALPFEAYWQRRSVRAAACGAVAALAVIPLQTLFAPLFASASISGWHWLAPLAYAAFVVPRVAIWIESAWAQAGNRREPLERMLDAIVLHMSDGGDVTEASAQARDLFGVAPELLLANGFFERIHVADRVPYMCALADLRRGATSRSLDLRLRRACTGDGRVAGEFRPFAVEMMRSDSGERAIVAIVRRNDEMVALRAQISASAEKTEGVEMAKSRFLAAVSHELRTPLNAIIGFSDMLLHEVYGGFQDPRQREYVTLVRESGHHLLAVVNSILDVSRIESGAYATHPEPFRFREAIDMCHAMMGLQASQKKLDIDVDMAEDVGEIQADRRAMQQILINLVSNAIKFTPDGGRVTIGAKKIGSRLHFWVSDTGIGMSADELSTIGKPFMQVQNDYTRRFEGAGLGLSLVKGLVALHDGTMSIDSESGGGTTVNISLPAEGPKHSGEAEAAEIVAMPTARTKEEFNETLRKTA